jgi:HSP20 family protein
MYVIRRNPINEVQNLVTSVFNGSGLRTNIEELESDYIVTVEVPGVSKKDITIDYDDSYLTISVEKKEENSNKKYLRKEITETSFSRSFYLENVNEDKIKAKLEDGILTIKIEKSKPEVKNKKIKID